MKRDLAIRALDMAVALRQPPEGCICYPAGDYNVICREGTIRIAPLTVSKKTVAGQRDRNTVENAYQRRLSKHGFKVSPLAHVNIRCPLPPSRA
jgi:putative transposase